MAELYERLRRAREYSARVREYRRKNRRNYCLAIALGLALAAAYIAWQCSAEPQEIEYPVPPLHKPVVAAVLDPIGEFSITAYCPCEECCGVWAQNRPDGIVYTASGEEAAEGVTVAVDPDVIPLGTEICIEGMGVYKAQDTGNFGGNVIDVYFTDHETATQP